MMDKFSFCWPKNWSTKGLPKFFERDVVGHSFGWDRLWMPSNLHAFCFDIWGHKYGAPSHEEIEYEYFWNHIKDIFSDPDTVAFWEMKIEYDNDNGED
jgi:hypothetical protein